jgi:hypothetical protein
MKHKRKIGQAMLELLIGILALMSIFVCIITFGEGGYHWLSSLNEASAVAWGQAVSPNSAALAQASAPQPFINDWINTSGGSQRMQELGLGYLPNSSTSVLQYNFQDVLVPGSPATFNATAQQVLGRPLVGGTDYVDYLNYTRPYLQSQPLFSRALGQTTTSGWLLGQSTHRFALGRIDRQDGNGVIDFGSGLQALIYNRDSIDMQSQVFLPPLCGLQ